MLHIFAIAQLRQTVLERGQVLADAIAPVGTVEERWFNVGPEVAFVSARAVIGENTLALVLTDPDGIKYGSAISLPVLGDTVSTGAPAHRPSRACGRSPCAASVHCRVPTSIRPTSPTVTARRARSKVKSADRQFRPDTLLKRSELAQYLMMGASVRQYLPFNGRPSFTDLGTSNFAYPFAESVIATGAPLRNLGQNHAGVMGLLNGQFRPNDTVTRVSLAYSLVQSMGLQDQAVAFNGPLTAFYDGKRIAVDDAASIAPALRGYVQLALDQGLINARFTVTQGPFDLAPTLHAFFDPAKGVTRAAYAVAASRYQPAYQSAED